MSVTEGDKRIEGADPEKAFREVERRDCARPLAQAVQLL